MSPPGHEPARAWGIPWATAASDIRQGFSCRVRFRIRAACLRANAEIAAANTWTPSFACSGCAAAGAVRRGSFELHSTIVPLPAAANGKCPNLGKYLLDSPTTNSHIEHDNHRLHLSVIEGISGVADYVGYAKKIFI